MSEFGAGPLEGGFERPFLNNEDPNTIEMPEGIPKMMFWRLLLYPYIPPRETKGGILLPDSAGDAQEYFAFMAKVISVGPKAFKSRKLRVLDRAEERSTVAGGGDPNLPATQRDLNYERREITTYVDHYADDTTIPKAGDWVIFQRHAGLRIEYCGLKFFMCDDDAVLALIDSPEGYKAYV